LNSFVKKVGGGGGGKRLWHFGGFKLFRSEESPIRKRVGVRA